MTHPDKSREVLAREAATKLLLGEKVGGGDGNTYCVRTPTIDQLTDALLAFVSHQDGEVERLRIEREGFEPCPTCRQYSHSLGQDQIADAFLHFQSMYSHRGDGIPTQFTFDPKTRDAAQVLMTAARAALQPRTSEYIGGAEMHWMSVQETDE